VLAAHFAATLTLLVAGIALYVLVTPYHEVRLIRADRLEAAERELRQRRTVARVACLTEAGRRARR